MPTVYSISSNGAFTDEHEASTETLSDAEQMLCYQSWLCEDGCYSISAAKTLESPPRIALSKRFGWGKKIRPVRNARSRRKRWPWRILFFLLLSSCRVLGGRDLCAGSRQGSAGPTVEHVGSLQCTPCLWLKAYTATNLVF